MANKQPAVNTTFLPVGEYLTTMTASTATLKRTLFAYLKIDAVGFYHICKFLLLTETADIQETEQTLPTF